MKTFKTIKIIMIVILLTSGFAIAQVSSIKPSEPVFPERPVKSDEESDAAFVNRLNRWQAEIRSIAAKANYEISPNNPSLPKQPVKREGEVDASYNDRVRQWEAEIRSILSKPNSGTIVSSSGIPVRPEKRAGESDASFRNRTTQWEAEVRRLTSANPGATVSSSGIPVRPEKRAGESDALFRNRTTQWEAEVRRIISGQASQQQKDEELKRLKQEIDKLTALVSSPSITGNSTGTGSESMLIIPSGEIGTEELLSINEDMNIMSRIFSNELQKVITSSNYVPPWENTSGALTSVGLRTGRNLNLLSSMYLQDYGALFFIKVDFPLSAPPETQEQPKEPKKDDLDNVWQQTKQQISEQQRSSMTSLLESSTPEALVSGSYVPAYDAQKVENLKTSFMQALKHASNIRALQPDESVILRISGISTFTSYIAVVLDDQYFVKTGNSGKWVQKEDLPDNITLLPPTAISIRAKKSDIDAFARNELDLEQFRQRVQIISFPLLQTTLPSTTTTGRTTNTRRTDTGTTTAVVPTKPTYETNN